jgi:hypothetical protein
VVTVPASTPTPTLAAEVSSPSSPSSPSQSPPSPSQSRQSTELQVSFSTKEHSTSELNGGTPKSSPRATSATVSPPSPSPPPSHSLYVSNKKNKEEPPSPKKKKRGSGSFRVKLGLGSKVETRKAMEHFAPSTSATTASVQSSHSAPTLSSLAEPGVPPKQRKWAQARQGTLADEMVQMNESIEKKKKEVVHAPPKRLMEAVAGAGESLSSSDLREKVIQEIIDTEKEYVQDLEVIINVFLTPLRDQTILAAVSSSPSSYFILFHL